MSDGPTIAEPGAVVQRTRHNRLLSLSVGELRGLNTKHGQVHLAAGFGDVTPADRRPRAPVVACVMGRR